MDIVQGWGVLTWADLVATWEIVQLLEIVAGTWFLVSRQNVPPIVRPFSRTNPPWSVSTGLRRFAAAVETDPCSPRDENDIGHVRAQPAAAAVGASSNGFACRLVSMPGPVIPGGSSVDRTSEQWAVLEVGRFSYSLD